MWPTLRERLQDWYVLIVALCLIIAFSLFASYQNTQSQTPTIAENTENNKPENSSESKKAENPPKTSVTQNSPPPASSQSPQSPAASNKAGQSSSSNGSERAASTAATNNQTPAASHDHTATAPAPAQTSGQGPNSPTVATGDAAAGRQVFRKCQACHSLDAGKNILGPSLAGVMGRKAGSMEGYNYSPAMKQANITWDPKTLDAYLADPGKTLPGNKMPFPGLKTDHDRADIIAFLASLGGAQQAATTAPSANAAPPPQGSSPQPSSPPPAQAPQSTPGSAVS